MTDDNVRQIWSDAELDAALADLHGDLGPDDGLAFARASLLAAAGAPPEEEAPEPRKSRGSWRWIAVAAAVTALTGGLVVATQIGNQDPATVAPAVPAGPPGLDQMHAVDLTVQPGEYRHTITSKWNRMTDNPRGSGVSYLGEQADVWVPADPKGIWHQRSKVTNTPVGLTVPDPQLGPASPHTTDQSGPGGMWTTPGGKPYSGSWDAPTGSFIDGLPLDVGTLRDQLVHDSSVMGIALGRTQANTPSMSIQMVRRVLSLGVARGETRLALWRALAQVPGITTTPGTTTPDGRTGIGFTAADGGDTLIADPATAQLIAYTLPPKKTQVPNSTPPPPLATTITSMPNTATPPPPFCGAGKFTLVEVYRYEISKTDK